MAQRAVVRNVVAQFQSLNERGERIGVVDGFGSDFKDKRYSIFHKKGGRDNHFQGVQRIGNHLLVTGSFPHGSKRSDLLVFQLASRAPDPGPWGSNMLRDRNPPTVDRLVNYFSIDRDFWHPGGFSVIGNTAVVPLENSHGDSRIVFLDVGDPAAPVLLPQLSFARSKFKAGACAITQLPDERMLLGVWSDSDFPPSKHETAPFHLDVYVGAPDLTGFELVAQFFPELAHACHCKFQSIDFIWEGTPAQPHSLFLVGFENTDDAQPNPLRPGVNRGLLFQVDLDTVLAASDNPPSRLPQECLEFMAARSFSTSGNWCNMDAGACAYVDSSQQLIVYSVYHFIAPIRGETFTAPLALKCLEFRATRFAAPITVIEDAWIDLYEEPGLQGRRLALLGPWHTSIEDSSRVFTDDRVFDVTASIRYQLPAGTAFVLHRDVAFGGAAPLVLGGTGEVREVDVIGTGFGGAFRSCRLQLTSVASAMPDAILV